MGLLRFQGSGKSCWLGFQRKSSWLHGGEKSRKDWIRLQGGSSEEGHLQTSLLQGLIIVRILRPSSEHICDIQLLYDKFHFRYLRVKPGASTAHEIGNRLIKELRHVHVEGAQLYSGETREGLHNKLQV